VVEEFTLVDEATYFERHEQGDYHYVIQLLKDCVGQQLVRMSYYRRPPGGDDASWTFAGQTSITTTVGIWRALLAEAMQKSWFKSLLGQTEGAP
jgi:hypothetical protein